MAILITPESKVICQGFTGAQGTFHSEQAILYGTNLVGGVTPGIGKIGIMPGYIHKPGGIGVVSRSGTLCYETTMQTIAAGFGQSSVVGIGGDPVNGLNYVEVLELFFADPGTEAVVIIGEIGGTAEVDAADFVKHASPVKPVAAFIAGAAAPRGRQMGHAGAIVSSGNETAQAKKETLRQAGVEVADTIVEIGDALHRAMGRRAA